MERTDLNKRDIIFVRGLQAEVVLGIWEWERQVRQRVVVDLEMEADVSRAAAADGIEATINYKEVAERVGAFAEASRCRLVETLAEQIARLVVTDFSVPRVRVQVSKPQAIRESREVGVFIERTAADFNA